MIRRFFAEDADFADLVARVGFGEAHIGAADFLEYRTPADPFLHAFTLYDRARMMVARRVFDGPTGPKWNGGTIAGGTEIHE